MIPVVDFLTRAPESGRSLGRKKLLTDRVRICKSRHLSHIASDGEIRRWILGNQNVRLPKIDPSLFFSFGSFSPVNGHIR